MTVETIVGLAARGDGVTETGRFVPFTAPGDRVLGDADISPGPHRRKPPCRHFPECGGCQLQHVDDQAYAQFLVDRIISALAAQGVAAPEIQAPHISPPRSRRRASLHYERGGRLGFHAQASHRVIDMRECHVVRPELFDLVGSLRELLGRLGARTGAGARLTLCDQGVDLLLDKVDADGLAAAEALSEFASRHRLARLALDDGYGPQVRWEPEAVTATLAGVAVPLPTASFLQATAEGEAVLVAAVREAVGGGRLVADLFAGLGTFAFAQEGRILAAEGGRDAVLAMKAGAARSGRTVFADHRDLFRRPLSRAELDRFEAVVLDPPRAGAREQAAELARSSVPRLAYVSCNPSTFARDAKTLVDGGYRLRRILPVGQFRWSTHVELAAAFER
ncbi:MAG TPA: class I SAM-dependent RNA methyltransferase [Allosphingosinicella sp.]|nr:class I SAM-dependent RNA methyltransferase [Allosphingosinicella sp.]